MLLKNSGPITVFWFRRDLRLDDNAGLFHALKSGRPVLPIFIFDEHILEELPRNDARVQFIYERLVHLNESLKKFNSALLIRKGEPLNIWQDILKQYPVAEVFFNRDYEPYARQRDKAVYELLKSQGIGMQGFKDQVIFERAEVVKSDGNPYTVYTPYKNAWLSKFRQLELKVHPSENESAYVECKFDFPSLEDIGFQSTSIRVREFNLDNLDRYAEERNFPAVDSTSYLSPHLRFGTIGLRKLILSLEGKHDIFLSELIWREFFMQILFHFPRVIGESFKPKYDGIVWRNDEGEFRKWCEGKTGFPMVDAGMRQLNETGYMHNRVRMVTASFLCKHLLIDWRWGEAYFAQKLLDFELSSNNGNWQWAAGTGCDAAPYFRVFNPHEQLRKFDPDLTYVRRWIPEFNTPDYPKPMIDHAFARKRALEVYKSALEK